ncbi:site-specific DNA-methyltransferase [uncultured Prevotella sp.]|uniref:site-specific DNA-methyltransferase n=1 Tax=uncultured Prevotella sp. TaxID=159272 RepID=UPI002635CAE9|nr:site-specific DNA-methyltransferase [uncultured Prevotella sp.]
MIKDIIDANNNVAVGAKEIEILKEHFPVCFHNGSFDIERLKEYLKDKINITEEGYELRFLGKNYARLLASLDTTTVIVPDEEHNNLPENKDSKNIYISGDNLDALKHLLKSYAGSIKCIYIDPPYNTGSDDFVYTDSFNFTVEELASKLSISEEQANRILDLTRRGSATHSAWLMFMLPRLLLARDLLSKDGVIFISIDDNEQSNLKLLCDDVFGEENQIAQICVQSNPRGRQSDTFVATVHDYLIGYARDISKTLLKGMELTEEQRKEYSYEDVDGRKYRLLGLRQRGVASLRTDRPEMFFPIYVNRETLEISLDKHDNWECIIPKKSDGREGRWMWGKDKCQRELHRLVPRYVSKRAEFDIDVKDYLESEGIERYRKHKTIWIDKAINNQNGTQEVANLLCGNYADYPKPVDYIKMILNFANAENCLVLDFFGGSATTAEAVLKFNKCQFIVIQLPFKLEDRLSTCDKGKKAQIQETINWLRSLGHPTTYDYVGFERIIRASKKIRKENPLFHGDLGFKHFTLKEPTNQSIEKMERFDPHGIFGDDTLVDEFGVPTILTTWLVRDGYGLTSDVKVLNIEGYELYYIDKHLYIINPHLSNEVVAMLLDRYQSDADFNPQNIVIYGYALSWGELQGLKDSLRVIRDGEKNMRINFDIRY